MSADFVPQNDLERQLLAAQEGQISPEVFLQTLIGSEVFMPVYEKYQIAGLATGDKAQPLKLQDEDGQDVLILFTSPERAKAFVRDYPGYGGGLLAEFTWILEKLGVGYAISINPGWEVGIDLHAEDVARLVRQGGAG